MTSNPSDDKILDHTRQQLSALFDGELGPDEGRFLQRRLEHDGELAATWSRWQLAGDALRGRAVAPAPAGFADRVAAAVATAGSVPAAARATRPRRRFLVPGAALAASVAALAMFMTRELPETAAPAPSGMEIASTVDTVPARPAVPAPEAPATPAAPDGALQVAGTAIAVAEVPRRAAERRSRSQQQRAATTRSQRQAARPQAMVAVAGAPATPSAEAAGANPFVPEAAAEAITTRPWPRSLLPTADGAFNVGYGQLQPSPGEGPFQRWPQPQAGSPASQNEDTP